MKRKPHPEIGFTEHRLKQITPPATGRSWYRDSGSPLLLMVTPTGVMVFYIRRRVNGRPVKVRIGPWPDLKVSDARVTARDAVHKIAQGIDPAEARRQHEAEQARREYTFADAVTAYRKDREAQGVKASTLDEYQRLADKYATAWKPRPLSSVDKSAVLELHRRIGKKHGEATANALMRVVRAVMRLAIDTDRLVGNNPTTVLKGRWFAQEIRETVIPAEHLPAWFEATAKCRGEGTPVQQVAADLLELILLTGMRRSEASRLKWADINIGILTVADTKNKATLRLPVTPAMQTILDRRKAAGGRSSWIFPSVGGTRKSREGYLKEPRSALAAIEAATGVSHSTHDLRRTFISTAAPIVPAAVLKSLVNHKQQKSGDVTQRHYVRLTPAQIKPHLETVQAELMKSPEVATVAA